MADSMEECLSHYLKLESGQTDEKCIGGHFASHFSFSLEAFDAIAMAHATQKAYLTARFMSPATKEEIARTTPDEMDAHYRHLTVAADYRKQGLAPPAPPVAQGGQGSAAKLLQGLKIVSGAHLGSPDERSTIRPLVFATNNRFGRAGFMTTVNWTENHYVLRVLTLPPNWECYSVGMQKDYMRTGIYIDVCRCV